MLDLQELWDSVMKLEADAERSRKSIKTWESRNRELTSDTAKADAEYKNINLKIKQDELELTSIESKIEKSESGTSLTHVLDFARASELKKTLLIST